MARQIASETGQLILSIAVALLLVQSFLSALAAANPAINKDARQQLTTSDALPATAAAASRSDGDEGEGQDAEPPVAVPNEYYDYYEAFKPSNEVRPIDS
jgi:hypothetical protein